MDKTLWITLSLVFVLILLAILWLVIKLLNKHAAINRTNSKNEFVNEQGIYAALIPEYINDDLFSSLYDEAKTHKKQFQKDFNISIQAFEIPLTKTSASATIKYTEIPDSPKLINKYMTIVGYLLATNSITVRHSDIESQIQEFRESVKSMRTLYPKVKISDQDIKVQESEIRHNFKSDNAFFFFKSDFKRSSSDDEFIYLEPTLPDEPNYRVIAAIPKGVSSRISNFVFKEDGQSSKGFALLGKQYDNEHNGQRVIKIDPILMFKSR